MKPCMRCPICIWNMPYVYGMSCIRMEQYYVPYVDGLPILVHACIIGIAIFNQVDWCIDLSLLCSEICSLCLLAFPQFYTYYTHFYTF